MYKRKKKARKFNQLKEPKKKEKKMEKNNLIKRITDEKDKRKSLIILTEHAKSLKKCSDKISDEMLRKMDRGFSEEEIYKFEEYLHRIIRNLEENEEGEEL